MKTATVMWMDPDITFQWGDNWEISFFSCLLVQDSVVVAFGNGVRRHHKALLGTYRAPPVRLVHIPKRKGKQRSIGVLIACTLTFCPTLFKLPMS